MTTMKMMGTLSPELEALWLYEIDELSQFHKTPKSQQRARDYIKWLPEWDGVPRLQAWIDASVLPALQPLQLLPSVWQRVKLKTSVLLTRLFSAGRL